jgi:hypothetical protein
MELPFNGSLLPAFGNEAQIMQRAIKMNVTCKTPTYYAEMHAKNYLYNVFVKGPFKAWHDNISYQCFVDELKPLFGLNKIGTHIAIMTPSSGGEEKHFLIMRDFGDGVKHYPVIETDGIEKIDKEKIPILQMVRWLKKHDVAAHPRLLKHYVEVLLFRQIVESSDTNNTNIIVNLKKENPILSVDENHKGYFLKGKLFSHRPPKKWSLLIQRYFKTHQDEMIEKLKNWQLISQKPDYQKIAIRFDKQQLSLKFSDNIAQLGGLIESNQLVF